MTLDILLLFIFCLFLLPQIILTATTVTPVIQFSDGQIQNPGPTPFSSSTSSSTPHNASSTPSSSSTSSSSIQNASPFTSNKPTKSPEPTKAPTSTSSTFTCKSGTQYGSPITTSLHCDSSKSSHPFSGNDEHYVLGDAGSAFCDGPLEALNPASQVIYGIEIFQPEVWYWDGYWAEGRGLINETTASNLHKQNKFHLTVEALPDCCPGDVYQFYQLDPKKSKTKCMNTFQLAAINCDRNNENSLYYSESLTSGCIKQLCHRRLTQTNVHSPSWIWTRSVGWLHKYIFYYFSTQSNDYD